MHIPGYTRLNSKDMIERGDYSRSILLSTPDGMIRTRMHGFRVSETHGLDFYRPLPMTDAAHTADIDKLRSFLLSNFNDDVMITEKPVDTAIRLLTKFKAVREAVK